MRIRTLRLATVLAATVALVAAFVPLSSPASAATPAPSATATPAPAWWEKDVPSAYNENCRAYGEVCFPLYNTENDSNLQAGTIFNNSWTIKSWFMKRVTSNEFQLRNLDLLTCLTQVRAGAFFTLINDASTCSDTDERAIWHLIPVVNQPSQYLLVNREGECLVSASAFWNGKKGKMATCNIDDREQWFQARSKAQAKVFATWAINWAQSTCVTNGKDNGTCSFTPADPSFNQPAPDVLGNSCNPADVMVGSPTSSVERTYTESKANTNTSASTNENSFGVEAAAETGVKDVWKASIKTSYSHKWSSTLTDSTTRTVATADKITIPAGQFAWIYTPVAVGKVPGTYTFFSGQLYRWTLTGMLDVPVGAENGGLRMLGFGSLVDYNPSTFNCHIETAVLSRSEAYVTGYDQGVDTAPRVGQTVTVDPGSWSASGLTDGIAFTYQWMRGANEVLRGATDATYTVRPADAGQQLWVKIRATHNNNMPGYATSLKTNPVLAAATTAPTATPSATPSPTPSATPSRSATPTPSATPTTAPAEDAAATTLTAVVASDQASGRPAVTLTLRSDAAGVGGDIVVIRKNGDGTETEVGRQSAFARAGRAVATTTWVVPDAVPTGAAEFTFRFVPALPAQHLPTETALQIDVPPAGAASATPTASATP
jgi:hypothetical protein